MYESKKQQQRFDANEIKRVILVGTYTSNRDKEECYEHLKELNSLSYTYNFDVIKEIACPIKRFNPATYIGSGKLNEIKIIMEEESIDCIIFDNEISPNQQKNIEEIIGKPVLDRNELILEIFAARAKTKEALLQIELAKIHYQLPRLKRLWTHLSREKSSGSATGTMRGGGEKQIEVDRRICKQRANVVEKELLAVREQRGTQRHARRKVGTPTFAIVGYTNAGKSSLLNALTKSDVLVENKLFATLDTASRQMTLPNKQNIILIDTVGFIRKLPHFLVEAFKSTLEESVFTDVLVHVIDASSPSALENGQITLEVLHGLGVVDKPIITVLNKIDQCTDQSIIEKLTNKYHKTVLMSITKSIGFERLLDLMQEEIKNLRKIVNLRIPQSNYNLVSELMKEGRVICSSYEDDDILIEIEIPIKLEHKVQQFII